MTVVIIRRTNDFSDFCELLPKPQSISIDSSDVNERAPHILTILQVNTFNNF